MKVWKKPTIVMIGTGAEINAYAPAEDKVMSDTTTGLMPDPTPATPAPVAPAVEPAVSHHHHMGACPGGAELVPAGLDVMLRLVFGVYREGTQPSFEVFFVEPGEFELSKDATDALAAEVTTILAANTAHAPVPPVVYLGYGPMGLTADQKAAARTLAAPILAPLDGTAS